MPGDSSARSVSAQIIGRLLTDQSNLSRLLPDYLPELEDSRDRALAQELCFGVCRWYFPLEYIFDQLLTKKLKKKDNDLKALILIGLYQFIYLRIPPHAIVSATVEACINLNKGWARGLINALLRRFQREQQQWTETVAETPCLHHSMPTWLFEMIQKDYPNQWQDICINSNKYPPMFLRANQQKITADKYQQLLAEKNIQSSLEKYSLDCLCLESPVDVKNLPGFFDGFVSVQDLAAQLCAGLLDLENRQRILDTCCAPGGKLSHILESGLAFTSVTALEKDPDRLNLTRGTLSRLNLTADLKCIDALLVDDWWDGNKFDRILLDAPCSASGVIRRHPDIKLMRQPEDIHNAIQLQATLLRAVWPLLKSGGKILYVTCSILTDENDQQIEHFLETTGNAEMLPIACEWGTRTHYGRQTLPGQDNMDGFYYSCLLKK